MKGLPKIWLGISVFIALSVLIASLLGIIDPKLYSQETPNWALQAVGQDIGNLLAVLILLLSLYNIQKQSWTAFFIWTGALFYFIYAYLLYAFFVHFNYLFLVYVWILGLSVYALLAGWLHQDLSLFTPSLSGKTTKAAGFLLIGIGSIFGLLWLSEIIPAIFSGTPPESAQMAGLWVNPIHVIDLALVLPGMTATGILLLKGKTMGCLFTLPWLTFSALMGISLMMVMVMELEQGNQAALAPLILMGIIVVSCLVTGKLYGREL